VCVCVFGLVEIKRYFFGGGNERSEAKEFSNSKSKTLREEEITTRGKVPSPPRTFLAREISSSQRTKQAAIPLWPFLDTVVVHVRAQFEHFITRHFHGICVSGCFHLRHFRSYLDLQDPALSKGSTFLSILVTSISCRLVPAGQVPQAQHRSPAYSVACAVCNTNSSPGETCCPRRR